MIYLDYLGVGLTIIFTALSIIAGIIRSMEFRESLFGLAVIGFIAWSFYRVFG